MSLSDEDVDLRRYKSYQWLDQAKAQEFRLNDPEIDFLTEGVEIERRPELEARFCPMIDKILLNKGYVKSADGKPDFFVTYYAKAANQNWVSTWRGSTPGINNVPVVIFPEFKRELGYDYRLGNIYLVLYDPRTFSAAWTGTAADPDATKIFKEEQVVSGLKNLTDELVKSLQESG